MALEVPHPPPPTLAKDAGLLPMWKTILDVVTRNYCRGETAILAYANFDIQILALENYTRIPPSE